VGWITANHASELEGALGVVGLVEGILVHFDAEVEAEEAEVAHVECLLHLRLECLHSSFFSASDDEAVDVDADE
jgi:hypothetical protein